MAEIFWFAFTNKRTRLLSSYLDRKSLVNRGFYFVANIFRFNTNQEYKSEERKPTVIRAPNKLLRIVYAFSVLTSFYRFLHSNAALSKNYELLKSAKHKIFSCVESKRAIPSGQDGAIWLVRVPNENTGFALLCPLALLTI